MSQRVRYANQFYSLSESENRYCPECALLLESSCLKDLSKSDFTSSAKVDAMLSLLSQIYQDSSDDKILIFSQFTSFLDIIEVALKRGGYEFARYDGKMNPRRKEQSLEAFKKIPKIRILLVSLKCGSTGTKLVDTKPKGLNLTVANHVIMADIWWYVEDRVFIIRNPSVESQAIDRSHRIGQNKPVSVTYEFQFLLLVRRLIVPNSVEERILELQEKKQALIDGALGDSALKKTSKLSVEEMLGLFGL